MSERRQQFVRAIANMRQYRQHTPRRRVPRQRHPFVIEVEYAKTLLGVITAVRATIAPLLAELPQILDRGDMQRVHHLIDQAQRVRRVPAPSVLADFARRTADHQRAQLARQVRAALGVELDQLGVLLPIRTPRVDAADPLRGFVAENVALIKSLVGMPVDEIERLITRAFANGDRHETLAKEIERRFGVAESRARLIARDQIGKLNAQMAREGNRQMGINQFRWLSMRDKAVRPQHQSYDRQSQKAPFSYDGKQGYRPPILPGQDPSCRCYDEPVFDAVLAELDALEAAGS